ncbi:tRNA pseudouridine(55) synthase TruB [Humisphaera borealis]|uniref:tRNA pseudouridine synthase B n=1 Tax=Humisphaera borealis TaxID=2807512 RepID=A0A7M2X409_9BACT|nr:tRNA pseudouridine(55) synthase TruB [Humisphaera borealis]QOV91500.1 tRNA pseudouridine(55) synthase TruB [Humisphaera borealis]
MLTGILNLDKPAGLTSARAVGIVKQLLPRGTKIGHAGTLDPFATGVLLLLVGKATKSCERLMDQPKQYLTTVRLGATTATDDLESEVTPWSPSGARGITPPTLDAVVAALPSFVGTIQQRPPAFSAMKIGGRRAYDLARQGQSVVMAPRPVNVYGVELVRYDWPDLVLRIDCGRGTYIRSIARDLGEMLDAGGYLTELRRTRSGQFLAEQAVSLETLKADGLEKHLHPIPTEIASPD